MPKKILTPTSSHGDPQRAPRREFLRTLASTSTLALGACAAARARAGDDAKHGDEDGDEDADTQEPEVTPGEDLMQEHGVLERVLLVYGEAARRLEQAEDFERHLLVESAEIVGRFVEDYHERNEEEFLFPRLEAAKVEVELVAVLRRQHARGREMTAAIARLAERTDANPELARTLRGFERMYRPHAAREDTVLYPAFRKLLGRNAYRELGEEMEERERTLLGGLGFEKFVERVMRVEQVLGLYDLARFTPA